MARIRGHAGYDRQRSKIKHYKMPQKRASGIFPEALFAVCTKKKRLHLRSDRIKRPPEQSTVFGSCGAAKTSVTQIKTSDFVSLRGRKAAVAIFKFEVWHPGAKHGSTKRQNPEIFDPSRRDTIMVPPALYHAAVRPYIICNAYIMQRSCISLRGFGCTCLRGVWSQYALTWAQNMPPSQ